MPEMGRLERKSYKITENYRFSGRRGARRRAAFFGLIEIETAPHLSDDADGARALDAPMKRPSRRLKLIVIPMLHFDAA